MSWNMWFQQLEFGSIGNYLVFVGNKWACCFLERWDVSHTLSEHLMCVGVFSLMNEEHRWDAWLFLKDRVVENVWAYKEVL